MGYPITKACNFFITYYNILEGLPGWGGSGDSASWWSLRRLSS